MTILIVIAIAFIAMLFFVLALVRGVPETPLEEQARCIREQERAKAEKKRRKAEKKAGRRA